MTISFVFCKVDLNDEESEMLDEVDQLFAQFPHDADFDEGTAKLIDVMRDRFVRLLKRDRFKELLHGILGIDPTKVDLAMCSIIKEGGLSYRFWDKCAYEELKFVNDAVKFKFVQKHVILLVFFLNKLFSFCTKNFGITLNLIS